MIEQELLRIWQKINLILHDMLLLLYCEIFFIYLAIVSAFCLFLSVYSFVSFEQFLNE